MSNSEIEKILDEILATKKITDEDVAKIFNASRKMNLPDGIYKKIDEVSQKIADGEITHEGEG